MHEWNGSAIYFMNISHIHDKFSIQQLNSDNEQIHQHSWNIKKIKHIKKSIQTITNVKIKLISTKEDIVFE